MNSKHTAECTACHAPMDAAVAGPCPNCGVSGTKLVYSTQAVTAKVTPSIDIAKIRHSFAFNKLAVVALIIITLVSPLISFLLPGVLGLVISYILAIIGLILGLYAITRVRDIEHYIDRR